MGTLQIKRGTAANWALQNPVLLAGQQGFETDTNKLKIGDGTTAWNLLPYLVGDGSFWPLAGVVSTTGNIEIQGSYTNTEGNISSLYKATPYYYALDGQGSMTQGMTTGSSRTSSGQISGAKMQTVSLYEELGGYTYSQAYIGAWSGSAEVSLLFESVIEPGASNSAMFRGPTGWQGVTYFADYSANFTNRSLVDKEYVDSVAGGGSFTFSNGLTESAGDVKLGGTLTAPVAIDGAQPVVMGATTPLSAFDLYVVVGDRLFTIEADSGIVNIDAVDEVEQRGASVIPGDYDGSGDMGVQSGVYDATSYTNFIINALTGIATLVSTYAGAVLNFVGIALNLAKGTDIASASTTDIGAADGNYISITGTTTITAFGTAPAGATRIVTFTGVLTLTHNVTSLILPTTANITTAVNDSAEFVSLGSGNWKCTNYQRADGTPLAGARVNSAASSSSITPDVDLYDVYTRTAQDQALTVNNPTGTPTQSQGLLIDVTDDGTARAITWDTDFDGNGATLPSTTTTGVQLLVPFYWNDDTSKWVWIGSSSSSFALTDGNGTTANGTAVDLGGTLTNDVLIDGNKGIYLGSSTPLLELVGNASAFLLSTEASNLLVQSNAASLYSSGSTGTPSMAFVEASNTYTSSRLKMDASSGLNDVFISLTSDGNAVFSINGDVGSAGKYLGSNGAGNVVWDTPSGGGGTPGGSDTQVQFNDGGNFGGDSALTYNKTTNTLTVDAVDVDDEAYDATGWNGDLSVPTKNAVRDKIETMITSINGAVAVRPVVFDGMGAVILTGSKTYVRALFAGTITGWSIIADDSLPTCTLDIKKIATGTTLPSSSIVASDPPDLTTGNAVDSTSLTGWTTSIAAGDLLEISVTAATVMTKMEFALRVS